MSGQGSIDQPELRQALAVSRSSFISTGVFSFFINILMLAPILYMREVYDRVLASNSESTLLMLTLLLVFLFLVMGALEWVRSQVLIVTGARLEKMLGPRVFESLFGQTLASGGQLATTQPLNDLLTLRQFLGGAALITLFDSPWLPIYLGLLFMFHPLMGAVGLFAAVVLIALAIANERVTRDHLKEANKLHIQNNQDTQRNLRNSEVVEAMGMLPRLRERWQARQDDLLALQTRASRKGGLVAASSKTFRMMMQSLMLGVGAYLAIQGEISGGLLIAGSLLLGRALAPVDHMIGSWKSFLSAREAYGRLHELLEAQPAFDPPMSLPPPRGEIRFEHATVMPAGARAPILKNIDLVIEPGTSVAVIGPSAAGKSSLVRAILGIHPTVHGAIRLDGAEIAHWNRAELGEHIGYLPQDVELLEGTVAENIARFGEVLDPRMVIAAATAAGVHEMILQLPEGYKTPVGGSVLSAGQRQRIGLARALYGNPRLVVLDEPNSNLDTLGDRALAKAIKQLRKQGSTVIVVTHRNNILELVDKILLLNNGEVVAYDDRRNVKAMLNGGGASITHEKPDRESLVRASSKRKS